MKQLTFLLLILPFFVAGGGCGKKETHPGSDKGTPAVVTGVTVAPVATTAMAEGVELSGTVRARTSAAVRPGWRGASPSSGCGRVTG